MTDFRSKNTKPVQAITKNIKSVGNFKPDHKQNFSYKRSNFDLQAEEFWFLINCLLY